MYTIVMTAALTGPIGCTGHPESQGIYPSDASWQMMTTETKAWYVLRNQYHIYMPKLCCGGPEHLKRLADIQEAERKQIAYLLKLREKQLHPLRLSITQENFPALLEVIQTSGRWALENWPTMITSSPTPQVDWELRMLGRR